MSDIQNDVKVEKWLFHLRKDDGRTKSKYKFQQITRLTRYYVKTLFYLGNKYIANSRTQLFVSAVQNHCTKSIRKFPRKAPS